MVKTETLNINGKTFVRTWSDEGNMIARDGVLYEEALDPEELNRIYLETDKPIFVDELAEMEQKAHAYDIIMGVAE